MNILERHGDKNINSVEDRLWEPMPRASVIDSGAAETVMPPDWFPKHEVKEPEGSRNGVYYTTSDGTFVHNEGEKLLTV